MFGEKIRLLRETRGYSQEYVADKLGIAQNTYSKIERGKTRLTLERMNDIATLLNVPLGDLFAMEKSADSYALNPEAILYLIKHLENTLHRLERINTLIERMVDASANNLKMEKELWKEVLEIRKKAGGDGGIVKRT